MTVVRWRGLSLSRSLRRRRLGGEISRAHPVQIAGKVRVRFTTAAFAFAEGGFSQAQC
jgi:hypothetical protein